MCRLNALLSACASVDAQSDLIYALCLVIAREVPDASIGGSRKGGDLTLRHGLYSRVTSG
jgi:hypothetical protein